VLPLVCLDVDGTLVGSVGAPTEALWRSADRARARGQHLTLCTARVAIGPTRDWAARLDPDGLHVFHTGGALWRPATDEVVARPLPDGAVEAAARNAAEHGWVFEAYAWDELAVDSDAPLAVAHAELLGIPHRRRSLDALSSAVVRAQYVVPIDELDVALTGAPDGCTASGATSPSMPQAAFVSVTAAGVSKAAGIASVAEHLGAAMDDVMMVGDGHNDLSAMAVVGWPVAIGDADPAVVAAARLVVADVDDDGAAEAIDRSAHLPRTLDERGAIE
jgi:Cof subfamily protein (haloacid dehalogenase superfamily)